MYTYKYTVQCYHAYIQVYSTVLSCIHTSMQYSNIMYTYKYTVQYYHVYIHVYSTVFIHACSIILSQTDLHTQWNSKLWCDNSSTLNCFQLQAERQLAPLEAVFDSTLFMRRLINSTRLRCKLFPDDDCISGVLFLLDNNITLI